MKHIFISKNFEDETKLDEWLNQYPDAEVVGYSAYGVGDVRYHTEFTAGVFVTIKSPSTEV